ncbi:MAG: WG repeat-containing protein [Eubacteriales bacterium]|nr:WG repeat-containing protein [Eubacteriales bacterium]
MSEMLSAYNSAAGAVGHAVGGILSVLLAFAALLGLLYCFFGFKLMRLWFAVCGFFAGAAIGFFAMSFAFHAESAGPHILAALAGGVLGAILLYRVYLLGVFLLNGLLSFLVFVLLLGYETAPLVIAGVCAVICGVLAVKFVRVWTILSTGVSGGLAAGCALAALLGVSSPGLALLLGAVIAVLGILFQWKTTGKAKPSGGTAAQPPESSAQPVSAGTPAAPAVSVPAAPAASALAAIWQDPKKRVMVCAGAGVVVVLAALALLLGGQPRAASGPAPRQAHADMGFKAADGKDIARSALWLDADSVSFGDPNFTPMGYYAGEQTAAVLAQWDDYELNYGLIDQTGNAVASGYEKIEYGGLVEGEPWFFCRSNDYSFLGFLNAQGERVLDLTRRGISPVVSLCFGDGLCIVQGDDTTNGRYGVIDTQGELVVPLSLDYDWISPPVYSEGYAMALKSEDGFNNLCGLIDGQGNEVIPCIYDSIEAVRDGKVIARRDGRYGALYPDGREAEPFTYQDRDTLAAALGWMKKTDLPTERLEDAYRDVEPLGGGLFAVTAEDASLDYYPVGMADGDGTVLVEPVHQEIKACAFEPGLFEVWDEGSLYFCDWKGERRTPDFDAGHYADAPVFRLDGTWGVLPPILTEKERAAFLNR